MDKQSINIYIYPLTARFEKKFDNPYIKDVFNSLEKHFVCVNKDKPSHIGIFNISAYFFKADVFHLNWIEDLPDKKGGIIQTLFFLSVLFLAKISGKKIIWTAHNKDSHHKTYPHLKRIFQIILARHSDLIITHSNEGIRFVKELNGRQNHQEIYYLPHPIKPKLLAKTQHHQYDIIIWGNIVPYKGIHLFLDYLQKKNLLNQYKILIIGKISSFDYEKLLKSYRSNFITIKNRFAEESELLDYIKQSRIILFTYQQEYVLSSGALTDSLSYGKNVIGPNIGAFRDLCKNGLINTYNNFDELIAILDKLLKSNYKVDLEKLNKFMERNSWSNYGVKLHEWITKK